MPELAPIRPHLFDDLHDAFLRDDDPLFSDKAQWRRVFHYEWAHDEDHSGVALIESGRVVGMMGMAFSTRLVRGVAHPFCNLHTWWVHPDHRSHSIMMLRPVLGMRERTLTYFTPGDRVRALLRPLGFEPLDMRMRLLLPLWPSRAPLRGASIAFEDEFGPSDLDGEDGRLMRDHLPYGLGHVLVREGARRCYVLYAAVERYRVRYCHIHHVGDLDLFARHEEAVRAALMRRHGVRLVALDARRLKDWRPRRSIDFVAPAHGLYRPARNSDVGPGDIDNLYSDVAMMRLATMPSLRHEIAEPVRKRLFPGRVRPS